MRKMSLVVLVGINLCLIVAYVAVIVPPAMFADEAPDANLCIAQCKQDCVDQAAATYMWCLDMRPAGVDCTQFAASGLDTCKLLCDGMNGCWLPN